MFSGRFLDFGWATLPRVALQRLQCCWSWREFSYVTKATSWLGLRYARYAEVGLSAEVWGADDMNRQNCSLNSFCGVRNQSPQALLRLQIVVWLVVSMISRKGKHNCSLLRCLTSGETVHETSTFRGHLLFLTGRLSQNASPEAASEKHEDEVKMFSKEEDNTPAKDWFTNFEISFDGRFWDIKQACWEEWREPQDKKNGPPPVFGEDVPRLVSKLWGLMGLGGWWNLPPANWVSFSGLFRHFLTSVETWWFLHIHSQCP